MLAHSDSFVARVGDLKLLLDFSVSWIIHRLGKVFKTFYKLKTIEAIWLLEYFYFDVFVVGFEIVFIDVSCRFEFNAIIQVHSKSWPSK